MNQTEATDVLESTDTIGVVARAVETMCDFQGVFLVRRTEEPESTAIVLHDYDGNAWVVTVEPLVLP